MQKSFACLGMFILGVAVTGCGTATPPPARIYKFDIGGMAVDPFTNTAAANVSVSAMSPLPWFSRNPDMRDLQAAIVATTTTDSHGNFFFTQLDAKDFFFAVMLLFGDADLGNTNWVSATVGVASVEDIKAALDDANPAFVAGLTQLTGIALPSVEVQSLVLPAASSSWANTMTATDIINHGFVFGMVRDANHVPVNSAVVARAAINSNGALVGVTPLAQIAYRAVDPTRLNFSGSATAAVMGAQFICADDLAAIGTSLPLLVALQGDTVSTATPAVAVTSPTFANAAAVEWVAP